MTSAVYFFKLPGGMAHGPAQFDQMEASLLYCPQCRRATPVRKRLLIVLPEGDKFDYVCTQCGTISGDKIERPPPEPPPPPAGWQTMPLPPLRRR